MFIRKTVKRYKEQIYTHYLLVETVSTPKGPRQKTICSLGDLSPGPRKKWMGLLGRVEAALRGQVSLEGPDPLVEDIVGRIRSAEAGSPKPDGDIVAVHTDQVSLEEAREAGPVHVGHQMWNRLGLEEILREAGLSARARLLSELMVLNRLVAPCSEHAMPEWVQSTALSDVLCVDLSELNDEALYRNLDRLHPNRGRIEEALAQRERSLFNLDDTVSVYRTPILCSQQFTPPSDGRSDRKTLRMQRRRRERPHRLSVDRCRRLQEEFFFGHTSASVSRPASLTKAGGLTADAPDPRACPGGGYC